jgi:NTE family protein
LSSYSVARAVTASSAFPVAFTPLTLKNYGKEQCGYVEPGWVGSTLGDPVDDETEVDPDVPANDLNVNPQLYDLAKVWRGYENAERRSYLHLSDGGLSDNIGLRAVGNAITTQSINIFGRIRNIERIAVIVVDAKPFSEPSIDHCARPSGIFTVLTATGTNPMENYSSDTVENFRQLFQDFKVSIKSNETRRKGCDRLVERTCGSGESACREKLRADCYKELNTGTGRIPAPDLHLIHVRFESIPDEREREKLQGIATRLQLPKEEVRSLIEWGARLLRESPEYSKLAAEVRGAGADTESPE